jgi:hypothetical protein
MLPFGGLASPMSKKGFSIKLDLVDKGEKSWYIGCIRHEMTHVLGFGHKGNKNPFYQRGIPFVAGHKQKGEMVEDTVHGFDIVYNVQWISLFPNNYLI